MDKLINVCLLHLALFLDMQTLPSSKACGVGMSRQDKQGVAPPQACSLARWPLLTACTCALALRGGGGAPTGPGLRESLGRRLAAPLRPGGTAAHLGPLLRAEGVARLPELWHQLSYQSAPFPGLASPSKF